MLSLEGFVYVLTSMFLFTTMTVGVIAAYRLLVGGLRRRCLKDEAGDYTARFVAGILIVASLMAMPSARLMEIPLLNMIPIILYTTYMVLGLYHIWKWRYKLLELVRCIIPSPKDCGCDRAPCECGGCTDCGDGPEDDCGSGGGDPDRPCPGPPGDGSPGDGEPPPCSGGDPCRRPPPPRWDGSR